MKYICDVKDLNLISLGNWATYEKSKIMVNCGMDTTPEIIDRYFGIDIMTNGKLNRNCDFWYVLHIDYNFETKEIYMDIDFCGASSEKYPNGFCYVFSNLTIGEKEYLIDFLRKSCLNDNKTTLEETYKKLDSLDSELLKLY